MPHALTPVLQALDTRTRPLTMFLRDDDAGWGDDALLALLDCTQHAGVPIDLAVIPQALTRRLAAVLCARIDAAPQWLGVHQHGHAHTNHELVGRRCEFGASRTPLAQRNDLRQGRARLQSLLGHRLDGLFTPPWNRCAPGTPALLAQVGITALSRDRTAPPQHVLPELAVDVDWCKHSGGERADEAALAQALLQAVARRAHSEEPLGLMLHHAQMAPAELRLLARWLPALRLHPLVQWHTMRDVLAQGAVVAA